MICANTPCGWAHHLSIAAPSHRLAASPAHVDRAGSGARASHWAIRRARTPERGGQHWAFLLWEKTTSPNEKSHFSLGSAFLSL